MLILHDFDLSAECYAVRLLAALLGVALDVRRIDVYPGREHEEAAFLALNPRGTVPVLETGEAVLCDWQAILVQLARRFDPAGLWCPDDDALQRWLDIARRLGDTAGVARLHDGMAVEADIGRCRREAHRLLRDVEKHLWFGERDGRGWLLPGAHPSIADLAVFVHVILCEEGGIARMDYPAVRRWTDRVRRIERFVPMSGVFAFPAEAAA
jgi:glutathione S-transferase